MIDLAKLNGMTEGVAEGIDDLLGAALDVSGVDPKRDEWIEC